MSITLLISIFGIVLFLLFALLGMMLVKEQKDKK